VLLSFACASKAAWSVQRSSSANLSGFTTLWKTSNCSQPGSFIISAQRILYPCASSEPFPDAAVIVTMSRIAIVSPLRARLTGEMFRMQAYPLCFVNASLSFLDPRTPYMSLVWGYVILTFWVRGVVRPSRLNPMVRQGRCQDDALRRARFSGRGTSRRKKRSAEYP
jgi:hypothetical protein